eukprot:COSAG06_NODE_3818_length_4876_cov_168.368223_4_plen_82_part_00
MLVYSEQQANRFRWETNIGFRVLLDSSGMPSTTLQWASLDENPNVDDWVHASGCRWRSNGGEESHFYQGSSVLGRLHLELC